MLHSFPGTQSPSHEQLDREADRRLKVNKTFKTILLASAAKFNGGRSIDYKPWKDALYREI